MLQVADLTVQYDDESVLRGVDLDVATGEIVCILGPSGGGKSSLLRAVAGLVAYSGRVRIDGRDVAGVPVHRRGVGLMFQDDLLFPHLDVAGNVGYGSRGRRVGEMLDLVGLPGYENRRVDTLSGGQAQRVALARALAPAPRLLLLDEPFGALDVVLKAALTLDVQRVLRAAGITVLAVTHDRSEAFTLADRVAVLRDGRLVQVGTPDALWREPADDYVAGLVGLSVLDGTPYAPGDLVADPGGAWEVTVTGRRFHDGSYLVVGRVGEAPVSYLAEQAPPVGTCVRLGVRTARPPAG